MAHRGKNYKLWFRRDLAVRTNNYASAFPEGYLTDFRNIVSPFFKPQLKVRQVVCVNTRIDSSIVRRWTSSLSGPGIELSAEVEIISEPDAADFIWHYRWRLDGGFRILDLKCTNIPLSSAYSGGWIHFQPEVIVKDSDITFQGDGPIVLVTAATWDEYPFP